MNSWKPEPKPAKNRQDETDTMERAKLESELNADIFSGW